MSLRKATPLIILALFIVAGVWFAWRGGFLSSRVSPSLPLDLKSIIPATWSVEGQNLTQCNFDDDPDLEWLLFYHYDKPSNGAVPGGGSLPASGASGPIGGVIYDAQVNRVSQEPANQSPYRPAFLVPYKLLPDIYSGKGQGYLGESEVKLKTYALVDDSKGCQAREIAVWGYSGGTLPTRLSVFRWVNQATGYQGFHAVGNARIEPIESAKPIAEVTTFNRLNDRSLLCDVQVYARPVGATGWPAGTEFAEKGDTRTIDFCFGSPVDPTYPEGVVVALLRGRNPNPDTPSQVSFLLSDAFVSPELVGLRSSPRSTYRVLSAVHPGTLAPLPGPGEKWIWSPPGTSTPEQQVWWRGRERAEMTTEIMLDGSPRQVFWRLVSLANERVNTDVRWRVERVELR